MITAMLSAEDDFEAWRDQARRLARIEAKPHDVIWQVGERPVDLFAQPSTLASTQMPFGVPKAFVDLAQTVICHNDAERFSLLYQSDWLMRFYGFAPAEVIDAADADGMLPLDIDPKLAWALKARAMFPLDVNRASRDLLLRVPGLGVKAVDSLIRARKWRRLRLEDVGRLTVSVAKVRPFLIAEGWSPGALTDAQDLRALLAPKVEQLELFA